MSSKYNDLAGVAPYFDDFDAKNNFMRILFNPSRAVQARELTQLQSILHQQSNQTAKHLFKNNSTITGARISTTESKPAAYLERFQVDNPVASDESNYNVDPGGVFENENAIVFDETWIGVTFGNGPDAASSDKQITITQYAYATDAGQSYPIIYYEFSGKNVVPGEIFTPLGDAVESFPDIAIGKPSANVGNLQNVVAADADNPFKALAASCASGIIYSQDHFLTVTEEEIIASNTPSTGVIEIGYRVVQDVVTENNTESVPADELDAEAGNVLLGQKLRDPASGSRNFNAPGAHRYRVKPHLFAITYATQADRAAKIAEISAEPGFESFADEFEPFMIIVDGRITKDQSEVQYADILKLLARRTFDESGNYTVEDFDLSLDRHPDDPTKFIAELGPGRAYVKGYEVNKKISTRLELDRARDTRVKDRTVKTLGTLPYFILQPADGTESGIEAGVDGGAANEPWIQIEAQEEVLILNTKIDPDSPGPFPSEGDPEVIGKTRVVSIDRDNDFIRLYLRDVGEGADEIRNAKSIIAVRDGGSTNAWVNLAQRRIDNTSNNTTSIFGGDIRPLLVKLSDNILRSTSDHRYQVVERMSVSTSGGQITINLPSGQEFRNRTPFVAIYQESDPSVSIDVSVLQVDAWSSSSITVSGANLAASENYVAYVRVERTGALASPTTKSLGANKTENITVNSFGTIGGIETDRVDLDEDLYDIVAVYQTSNLATTNATGDTEYKLSTDELLKLDFFDGQTDVQYQPGYVTGWKKLWRINKADPAAATNYRIEYRSFDHGSPGRTFTVNSYEFSDAEQNKIPRYISERFGRIDLINCMDFRQTVTNLNGSVTRAPLPSSSLEFAEEYYVGRIDIISLNRNGEFVVTKGVPSNNPTPPNVSEGSMILYKLHIPPYTFSTRDIQIEAHKNTRYTMKDISRLEDRIERLEDSVSLSLLEKNAMDMKITDPETGFDRFKSGIFVDNFEGLSQAETVDPEFYIAVDRVERTIHCPVEKNNINMNFSAASGTTQYSNLITLTPDATERIIGQNLTATDTINLNPYLFYTWVGEVKLTPTVDTWHETRYLPQRNVTVGSWDPPPGFDPRWRIDDIEVNWVGIDPDPNPLPPNPAPPQNSAVEDGVRHVDIAFSRSSHRNLMLTLANPDASQAEIDDAVAQVDVDALIDNSRRRAVLTGAALAARNLSGLEFDVDQEFIDEALRVIGFDGSTRTSTNLGSENVLSSSDSRQIAQQIGADAFNERAASNDLIELGSQTIQPIGDRLIGNAIANDSDRTGVGSTARNQRTAIQQQTITEVRDVLTRHTTTNREDRVVDRSEIFWLREQEIEFEGTGFRPGMFVSGFFDNRQVDIVADSGFEGDDDGTPRVQVDSEGNVRGYFKVPPRTFTTGTKVFLLLDDEETSQGTAEFTSRGILTQRQVTVTTTRSVSTRQVIRSRRSGRTIADLQPIDVEAQGWRDPIAQSFLVPTEGGCLVSSITVYFATKAGDFRNNSSLGALNVENRPSDNLTLSEALEELYPGHPKDPLQYIEGSETTFTAPVSVYIVEMRDGTPTQNIVPLSMKTLPASSVNSNPYLPEAGETEFRFDDPIYLEQDTEYAFIVFSTSKEYNIWMTELGGSDIFNDDSNGVGVAEQPYLGTLFKSQNSSTWTPEQNQTLTFKIQRYNYGDHVGDPTDKTVTFLDSKLEDTLLHDEVTGNLVDRDLYSSTFTGDPNDQQTFVSTVFPMFGELALAQTSIEWTHQFSDSSEMNMYNNKRNVVYNSGFPTNEYVIGPVDDYTVRAYMTTNNENVSPIIDIDQSRIIAIRNLVKGIETYDGAPLNFIEGGNSDGTGVLIDSEYLYQEQDVFKTDDGTAYIVMEDGVSFSTTAAPELAGHVANERVLLAEDVGLEINQNNIGDAGVYVSKPINLKNPADDLRLIIDTSEPGSSYVKPYYRILNHQARYVVAREEGDNSEQYRIDEAMAGATERLLYVDTPIGLAEGTDLSFERQDVSGNDNFISINGFDTKRVGSPAVEQNVVYFSGLTDNTAFNTANTSGRGVTAFATTSQVLKDAINNGETIEVWDSSAIYTRGSIVYHNGAFWHSAGYIGGISAWNGATAYTAGDIVTYAGSLYIRKVDGTTATEPSGDTTNWRELTSEYFGVGTVPTDPGSAWERIPSVFFKQDQDDLGQDDTSQWRPMVLKTGRFETNTHSDNRFYESTWVPKTDPGVEFEAFAIKLEFVTENSRAAVPRAKNLRVIATL